MIILLIEILVLVILSITLCMMLSYAVLKTEKYKVDIVCEDFYENLKTQYNNVREFLNSVKESSAQRDLIDEVLGNITKAMEMSEEKDGNERIIGYANYIFAKADDIKQEIKSAENQGEDIISALQNYEASQDKFKTKKDNYNESIKRLKRYVDVFPTSFVARLKYITTKDFIR